ncbi:uncharacterized protein LOC135808361 [Sycon ciliatum]|uniref:uncharacterized protein LOC135808361 n=1 Tax=Sycon ciliatum TaxID=27933 RepID=UPI0031F65E37
MACSSPPPPAAAEKVSTDGEQRQISPLQRNRTMSATHRLVTISPTHRPTEISNSASGDLAVSSRSLMHSKPFMTSVAVSAAAGRELMDGTGGGATRSRSSSLLSTWFGTGDGLNEVEQAELEIEKMITKIRRDLNHMHDQDLYFSKWIGTLGRKINNLETAVYSSGDHRLNDSLTSGDDEVDSASCADSCDDDSRQPNGHAPISVTTYSTALEHNPLSRSSSPTSNGTSSSHLNAYASSTDSDYYTDCRLAPIEERHSQQTVSSVGSRTSHAGITKPRATSCDSVDSLYSKSCTSLPGSLSGGAGSHLSRQDSVSSGIHADELLAMYSKREKGVRQEMGLASQGGTPNKRASYLSQDASTLRSPSDTSLVQEQPVEEARYSKNAAAAPLTRQVSWDLDTPACKNTANSANTNTSGSSTEKAAQQLDKPLTKSTVPHKPLQYNEIFEPPLSYSEACMSPGSPTMDDQFLSPRLAKRNSGIFGSVRLRQSLRNITRGRVQTTTSPNDKVVASAIPSGVASPPVAPGSPTSSPFARTEKTRWRWGSVRGSSSG